MKKVFCVVLSLALLYTCIPFATATDSNSPAPQELPAYFINGENKTQEEIDREVEAYIDSLMASLNEADTANVSPRVQTYYKSLTLDTIEDQPVSGSPGNQLEEGYCFSTGGGFYYSEDGGPTESLSFSVSLPFGAGPFSISVGVGLGNKADTFGTYVSAPDKTSYWKLYVTKHVDVIPIAVYEVDSPQAEITEDSPLAYVTETAVVRKIKLSAVRA